jgi:hypothetical protein
MASANAPPHELVIVPAVGQPGREELLNECFNIRIAVFVDEQGFSKDDEFDEFVRRPPGILRALFDVLLPPSCSHYPGMTHMLPIYYSAT